MDLQTAWFRIAWFGMQYSVMYVINTWNALPKEAINCLDIAKNENALNGFKRAIENAWRLDPLKYDFE